MSDRRPLVEAALGRVDAWDSAGGGSINSAALVRAQGDRYFVKWNDHDAPGQFAAEAKGLVALAESGTSLVVPRPLHWNDDGPGRSLLILEYIPPGSPGEDFQEALGRGLAEMHRTTVAEFGFELDGYCGATPQPNAWRASWVDFYREHRLGHQLSLAASNGLPSQTLRLGDRVLDRLDTLIDDDAPPALIHGDLWFGNLHVTQDGHPALVDPAAYFGHREAELGMMRLFGGFDSAVWRAYEHAWPLADGWRERLDLYSVYHVLNHFNLFGGGYGGQARTLLERYA